jgi:ABC-type transport system involved in multi-copper enzyme maturation permease subunit
MVREVRTAWIIARHTFRECARRRLFIVVPIATVAFISLYAVGNHFAFRPSIGFAGRLVDTQALTGASLVGLSMFVTLFLGSSLGIFLSFSAVRGDAETGVLQQLVVRPVARSGLLLGRFLGASVVGITYVALLYTSSVLTTGWIGGWWPESFLLPGLSLVGGVVIVIALTLLASVFLTALPTGIVMFMAYGAGLLGGLLRQLGEALNSPTLETIGKLTSWLLPFEALYQAGLDLLTRGATGLTRVIVQLGPLGGAESGGSGLLLWSLAYVALVGAGALFAFSRRDL